MLKLCPCGVLFQSSLLERVYWCSGFSLEFPKMTWTHTHIYIILFILIWITFYLFIKMYLLKRFWFKILQRKCLYTRLYCVEKSHKKNTHGCPHHTLGIRGWHDHQQGPGLFFFFFCSAVSHPLLSCCCSIKPGHIKHSYSCKPGKLRAWLFLIDSSGWSRKHEAVLNLYSRLVSCRQTATVVWGFLRVIFEVILMVWYCYGWYCQPNICTLQYIHISNIYKHI